MPARLRECACHPFEVWLDPHERRRADSCGEARYRSSIQKRSRDRGGRNEVGSHRFGARAELAASLILHVEWPHHVDVYSSVPDLPPDIEVRGSHGGQDLKMRESDLESPRRYVVVVYRPLLQTWRMGGWIVGRDAGRLELRLEQRRRDLAPALWVPSSELLDPSALIATLR